MAVGKRNSYVINARYEKRRRQVTYTTKKGEGQVTYIRDEKTGRFLVGTSGMSGRPRGSRNKLSEAMLADLYADWKAHGTQAIEEVRERRPWEYLRIVALIVRGASDFDSLADGMKNEAIEQIIEERHKKALLMIEKMKTR
jgi:hypothetical protein